MNRVSKAVSFGLGILLIVGVSACVALPAAEGDMSATEASEAEMVELQVEAYNPEADGLFPVTSSLITGPTEAVLIDAQFQRNHAQDLLAMIENSGKELTTIYISHGDPDYYFGLDVITTAYPDAKVVASPATIQHFNETKEAKVEVWTPILGDNAPEFLVEPEELEGDTLTVDGQEIQVIGLDGHDPKHTFLWIPSLKMVLGGVVLYENHHVWMADAPTVEQRQAWRQTLDTIVALEPATVIAGHYLGESSQSLESADFVREYLDLFDAAAEQASDSAELIALMTEHYPEFENVGDLELSAMVVKGEMEWP